MRLKRKTFLVKVLLMAFAGIILNFNPAFAIIWHNGAGGGYGDDSGDSMKTNSPIEMLIVEGGGYFFSAASNVQKLLELVELQDLRGVDYTELQGILDSARTDIQKAIETYARLIETAEVTPYNETVVNKLSDFDYKKFMLRNGLNSVVFYQVEYFLEKGNITGLFKKVHSDLKDISTMLETVNESVSSHVPPDVPGCLRLNEKFAEVTLFGSYTARVFSEI